MRSGLPDWVVFVALILIAVLLLALDQLIYEIRRLRQITERESPRPVRRGRPVIDVPREDLAPVEKERRVWRKRL